MIWDHAVVEAAGGKGESLWWEIALVSLCNCIINGPNSVLWARNMGMEYEIYSQIHLKLYFCGFFFP